MAKFKEVTFIIVFISLLIFIKLGTYPLNAPDGARYAEIPREMVASGDYITPHLNGVKYLEKPPLFYWIQAASIKTFGVNDFAVSLPNAILGLICCLAVFKGAKKIFGGFSGVLSALILATSGLYFVLTRIVTLDLAFTAFLTISLLSFIIGVKEENRTKQKYYMWSMYAFSALAVMTKGLIGAFFPMGVIFFWVLYFKEWRNLKKYCIFTGTIIFLIIALPWHVLAQFKNPDFFNFYIIQQHFLRYFTHYAGRGEPWWFFIAVFLIGLFPWVAFFYQSVKFNLSKQSFADESKNEYMYKHKVVIFLFIWFATIFIFYSFSTSKLITYLLPIFPSCAILLGNYFAKKWDQKKNKVKDVNYGFIIIAVLSIFAGIGIFFTSIFWDFKSQGVPVSELYLVGFFLIVNGIVTSCVLRKGVGIAFIALLITFSWALYSANPIVTILNGKSIKPLALILQKRLQPKDEVACYDDYYQDLPFYLQSQVDVVHSKGELEYGVLHDDATRQWMISYDTFFKRWNSKKKMYMIIKDSRYNDLVRDKAARLYVIGRYADKLLIVNAK